MIKTHSENMDRWIEELESQGWIYHGSYCRKIFYRKNPLRKLAVMNMKQNPNNTNHLCDDSHYYLLSR